MKIIKKKVILFFTILLGIWITTNSASAQSSLIQTTIQNGVSELDYYGVSNDRISDGDKKGFFAVWKPTTKKFPVRIVKENGGDFIRTSIDGNEYELSYTYHFGLSGERYYAIWTTVMGRFPVKMNASRTNFHATINNQKLVVTVQK